MSPTQILGIVLIAPLVGAIFSAVLINIGDRLGEEPLPERLKMNQYFVMLSGRQLRKI